MKETVGERDARIKRILKKLDSEYGTEEVCYLHHEKDWQLLFAVIMSAQCTDARVNLVTKELWKKYRKLEDVAKADLEEFEQDIRSTGFYHNKARNIIACAGKLIRDFGGKVPSDMESLVSLPGVGRKTANVVRGHLFNKAGIAVDTHVNRISNKLGLAHSGDPVKVEFELMKILPEDHWILWNTDIIRLGRTICIARREKCGECFLKDDCPSARKTCLKQESGIK